MFLKSWIEMGGFEMNHQWHGINMLSVLECALIAAALCTMLAMIGKLARRRHLTVISFGLALSFATAAYAANTALSALSASGALAGANLIYVVQTAGTGGVKATMTQVATFINSLFSGDATVTSGGVVTVTKTNGTAFGALATVTPGTGVATAAANALNATGGLVGFGGNIGTATGNITGNAATVTTNANLTGDVTSVGNVTTLATVNANVGTFGSATSCVTVTNNAKGLTTAISAATCAPAIGSITGLGTSVATALGINVGTAGSLIVNGGALGTPSSGVGTNLIGTAAGLTAGNANATPLSGITGFGAGNATLLGTGTGSAGGPTQTIASGATAMGTGAIGSAACATVVTATATNVATTDVVLASFNADPTAVTGYIPLTAGMLTIIGYPTSGNVNFKVCNNTAASVTPGAITLNWRVAR